MTLANGFLEITANNSNKSGIDLYANNPAPGLDFLLMCLNGTAGQAYTANFAIISKTLNVVGSNAKNGTTATITMYGATETIGSQDEQIICSGGNSSAVNNGTLTISSPNFNVDSSGDITTKGYLICGNSSQGTNGAKITTSNGSVIDQLALYMGSPFGGLVMSPYAGSTVYSSICQMKDAFIGY